MLPLRSMDRYPDFTLLYAAIGDAMTAYCDDAQAAGRIGPVEAAWFRALLVDFRRAFDDWGEGTAAPGINAYLEALERRPRLVRLAGHVFLHITVDLPVVIRRSFDACPNADRAAMRAVYLGPAPVLHVDVMRARMRDQRVRRLLAWIVGGRSLETLAHWVQVMRATAWIHAELAHDAPLPGARFERALTASLEAALRSLDPDADAATGDDRRSGPRARAPRRTSPASVWRALRERIGQARTIDRFARTLQCRVADALLAEVAVPPRPVVRDAVGRGGHMG